MRTYMTERDLYEQCREEMNEAFDVVNVGMYSYLAGDVLESVDPIAFRQECINYIDRLLQDGDIKAITLDDGSDAYQKVE